VTTLHLTRAPSHVILTNIMAAMFHLDLPYSRRGACAVLGIAQCNPPSTVDVMNR
jgi:hypothetical protein